MDAPKPRKRPSIKQDIEKLIALASSDATELELEKEVLAVLNGSSARNPLLVPIEIPHFHLPARQDIGNGHIRMEKLLSPSCNKEKMKALGLPENQACQNGKLTKANWWETCPHEPYMIFNERTSKKPVLEPILENGEETGRHRITGYEEEVWIEKTPSTRQVAVNKRINSGLGFNDALMKGCRLPSKPFCAYIECYSQDIVVKSAKYGNYCSEIQARYVAADARSVIMHTDAEKRFEQVMAISL